MLGAHYLDDTSMDRLRMTAPPNNGATHNVGLFRTLQASLSGNSTAHSFCIAGRFHTYAELGARISQIRAAIKSTIPAEEKLVGVVANDDLGTYAALLSLWAEGRAYLPLTPEAPVDRNARITASAGVKYSLCSDDNTGFLTCKAVRTDALPEVPLNVTFPDHAEEDLAYVLFTSGSTGEPKGVPITRGNLAASIDAFQALGIPFTTADKCLQMFELTFDVSVICYLVPLLHGACVYTIPKNEIKYVYVAGLIEEHEITFALLVPSIINYLRPYFDEIQCPAMKHCLFTAEALPLDVTMEWSRCIPNARIMNLYGPTEHTIFCTHYTVDPSGANKEMNGVVSIGRAMYGSVIVVMDDERRILPPNEKGELCLAGGQLTPGYWQDPEKTAQAIFHMEYNGVMQRFYRTGDLCTIDAQGDAMYLGRLDHQVKIQGYRVELSEIEHHARAFLVRTNAVALAVTNYKGINEVTLAIEGPESGTGPLMAHLREKLPTYMVPTRIRFVTAFPLNANGKTDRNALRALFTGA